MVRADMNLNLNARGRSAEAGPDERAFHADAVARFRAMNASLNEGA